LVRVHPPAALILTGVTALASEANLQPTTTDSARERKRWLAIFSRHLFERLAPEHSAAMSAEQRARIAAAGLDFFTIRTAPIKLRVFGGDEHDAGAFAESVMADRPFIIESVLEYFHHPVASGPERRARRRGQAYLDGERALDRAARVIRSS
jgi:hypothetical protein